VIGTSSDLADPSSPNTLMKIFLMEASLIFSMASRIFSALALAAASSGLLGWTVPSLEQGTTERTELLMVIVDFVFSPLQ